MLVPLEKPSMDVRFASTRSDVERLVRGAKVKLYDAVIALESLKKGAEEGFPGVRKDAEYFERMVREVYHKLTKMGY